MLYPETYHADTQVSGKEGDFVLLRSNIVLRSPILSREPPYLLHGTYLEQRGKGSLVP